jgi:hypothetical protein
MTIRLTDTQLLTLSAAAQRDDRCIAAPPKLKVATALKFATRLVAAGLVKEVKKPSRALTFGGAMMRPGKPTRWS